MPVHVVDLLQPSQALTDVLRAKLSYPVDRFQLFVAGADQVVEAAKLEPQ